MDGYVIVAIHYESWFVWNKNRRWECCDGRNKARAISKTTTFKELEDMVYGFIGINCGTWIKMKFIFYSYYKLYPIDIENDDIYYFMVEQLNNDKMQKTCYL